MGEPVGSRRAPASWRRSSLIATSVALVVLACSGCSRTSAASTDCLVTNVRHGQTFTALQAAVDAASPGQRLTVEGTCHGTTVIGKDLVISGIETEGAGPPILDADGSGSVVTVLGVVVAIEDLTITGGDTTGNKKYGGGLTNRAGTLTLRDVIVRDNKTRSRRHLQPGHARTEGRQPHQRRQRRRGRDLQQRHAHHGRCQLHQRAQSSASSWKAARSR